jgi:hypothetical protein
MQDETQKPGAEASEDGGTFWSDDEAGDVKIEMPPEDHFDDTF